MYSQSPQSAVGFGVNLPLYQGPWRALEGAHHQALREKDEGSWTAFVSMVPGTQEDSENAHKCRGWERPWVSVSEMCPRRAQTSSFPRFSSSSLHSSQSLSQIPFTPTSGSSCIKVQHRAWSLLGAQKASVEMHGWESSTLEYFSTQREGC